MIYRFLCLILLLAGCRAGAAATVPPTATMELPSAQPEAAAATPRLNPPRISTSGPSVAASAAPSATRAATSTATAAPSATPLPAATATVTPTLTPAPLVATYGFPIGLPDRPAGAGFFVRHGYQVENTWYNPGYWHTGEDWYALEGDTAGAQVFAIAAGTVVYVGANYPGRVVIIQHDDGLFSMYGHLDPAVTVQLEQRVNRGDQLGTVLRRSDDVPNHLHFEVRTFLTTPEVNGATPRYGFRCGPNCPPGPGYWPISAPDLPSDLGWRNPTHVISGRMFPPDPAANRGEVLVNTQPGTPSLPIWSAPPGAQPVALGELPVNPGARFPLLEVWSGPADTRETSALSYQLWYRIGLPDGGSGWVSGVTASDFETGGDGRPASVVFNFVPVLER